MPESAIIQQIRSHFDKIIAHGRAVFGPHPSTMWLASLDTHTGSHLAPSSEDNESSRLKIQTPGGVNFYWDQPHLVAACLLSQITGDPAYQDAVQAYVADFLARSVSHCGLLLWGNHYYYHVLRGETVWCAIRQLPEPLDGHRYSAWMHELRPIPPAWGLLWQIDPQTTERSIRAMGEYHLYDPATGAFNHHADQEKGRDFLESGAILSEALAWLYAHTGDLALQQQALSIARHSFRARNPDTGLLPVASTTNQWYHYACTTEVGLWAGSMLRAAVHTNNDEFAMMAQAAVSSYLYYGWDVGTGLYFGRLNIIDGTPQRDDFPDMKITPHQPDMHSGIWNSAFPTHDYPLSLAETCVSLFERTHQPEFEEAIHRFAEIIKQNTDDRAPATPRTAGQFGRALHFLLRAAQALPSSPYRLWAAGLADEATDLLFVDGMFAGSTGEARYDATDGVGYLLLALLTLEAESPLDCMGFGF